jgi:putative ABC transport system permease protein
MLMGLWRDVRFAIRMMAKTRGLTSVALVTLALGIGANTAVFSVVDAILIRPLPYADSSRLVMVFQDLRARGGPGTEWTGPANQADWKSATDVFTGVTTVRGWAASLAEGDTPEALTGEQTTFEYFDVLGARPALGRSFRQSDDVKDARRVVILSHAVWTSRFGGDPAAVGRVVRISGEPHEIIGVMPKSFRSAYVTDAALWRPLRWPTVNAPRNVAVGHTIARLRPDVTLDRARSQLDALAARLRQEHPDTDAGKAINPVPLQDQQVGGVRLGLFVLLGAVGFVLLIACVNIANLLLARASGRAREMAVRRALGAERWRIVRQLLTESVLLAAGGGAAGLLIAEWGVSALKAVAPAGTPRIEEVAIDPRVLIFAAALSLATGILFGLVPAWQASRETLTPALNRGGRAPTSDGGGRARRWLVVAELALALMLLVGAGLLVRTFIALQGADLGFNPDHVLAGFVLTPPAAYRTDPQRRAFYDRLLERAAAIPGVKEASLSSITPLGGDNDTNFTIEGRPKPRTQADATTVWYREVSAGYFSAIGIPLRHGRLFTTNDADPVVVINETMARHYWPAEDPIGRRMSFDDAGSKLFTIVGVVGDVKMRGPRGELRDEAYLPYWQEPDAGTNVVLKSAVDPASLIEPLKRAVQEIDPTIPVSGAEPLSVTVAQSNGPARFYATLVTGFAALALLLAAVGVFGVMSYTVSQRTAEIGVRVALGADERQIFRLVVGESLALAAIGLGLGAAGALAVTRALRTLLFGVGLGDPATFGGTALLLVAVAFVASYMPARRAMRVEPMSALRAD